MLVDIVSTERPDGERGNETALPAVGTCVSHTQLPEPHSGESAAAGGAAGTSVCDTAGQPQVHSILKTLRAEDATREIWR